MRTITRRAGRRLVALATVGLLLIGHAALADSPSADIPTGSGNTKTVTQNQAFTFDVEMFLVRAGQPATSLTWGTPSVQGGTAPCAGISAGAASPTTLAFPSAWADVPKDVGNNSRDDLLSPVNSTATISGTPSALGTCTFRYPITGVNVNPNHVDVVITVVAPSATDVTAPTWSCTPSAADSDWHANNQTHECTASDTSGLKSGSPSAFSLSTTVADGVENANASTGSQLLCDVHDNCTTAGPISGWKIDRKTPTIMDEGPTTLPNGAGWYNTDVVNQFSASDGGSGLASGVTSPFTKTTSGEGTNVKVSSGPVSDAVGNSNLGIDSAEFKIDKTKPTVTVTGVSDGATYTLGSVPTAGCDTTDGLSGVKTSATLDAPSGGPVGSVTVTCSGAEDNAGNTNSASVTYTVHYSWSGFLRPVDNLPTLNVAKAGSAIPVKFSLSGDQGMSIFVAGYPKSQVITCDSTAETDGIETTVTAGSSTLQYDTTTDTYTYVWKTDKAWAGTCRQLVVKLADGTYKRANFKLTK